MAVREIIISKWCSHIYSRCASARKHAVKMWQTWRAVYRRWRAAFMLVLAAVLGGIIAMREGLSFSGNDQGPEVAFRSAFVL